jgi:hypothetical protein
LPSFLGGFNGQQQFENLKLLALLGGSSGASYNYCRRWSLKTIKKTKMRRGTPHPLLIVGLFTNVTVQAFDVCS